MKKLLTGALSVVLVILVFAGTMYIGKTRDSNRVEINKYASSDVVYANGDTAHFNNKNFGMVNKGDIVTVNLALPEKPIVPDAVLTFYIYHSVTEISLNDKVLAKYGADIDAKNRMVGNKRFLVSLPEEAWGDNITITLRVTEDKAFNCINSLGVYEAKYAYQYYIDCDFIGFYISWPLIMLGLITLVAAIFSRKFNVTVRKCVYISSFAVLASLWIITSEGMQNFFGFTGYVWTQLEFVVGFTMAIPIMLYAFETESRGWFKKLLGITIIVGIIFVFIASLLNFTNVAHYCRTLFISHILVFLAGIMLLIFAARGSRRNSKPGSTFFNGMLIMFFSGLFDILRFNIFKYFPDLVEIRLPSVLAMGVLFFVIYMTRSYSQEFMQQHRKHIVTEVTAKNLNEILESTPAGICLFKLGDNLPIIEANETFYSIFGYTRESALNVGFNNMIFPLDDIELGKLKKYDDILAESKTIGTYEFELNITKADGSKATILSTFYYHGVEENRITANVIDITNRKMLERELRLSEERYKLALTQSGKVFFFFDVPSRTMKLSDELAQAFGLPNEVDNMPDNFISQGLVEPESVDNYRHFYERIISGEKCGDTIISCHMRDAPGQVLWYRIAFTSLFDSDNTPATAIITYEDLTKNYRTMLSSMWKPLSLVNIPKNAYVIAEYDLTTGNILSQTGGLFAEMPDFMEKYDEINAFVLASFIYEEDLEVYGDFLDANRLLKMFDEGITEDYIEYRSIQNKSDYRWTSTSIQMIKDPYSGHIMGQFLFVDIHEKKSGQIEMKHNMVELQKELESSRIKVMMNQMQPHFLYNALSAIRTITKRDPDYAYDLLYDFTTHLRSSIKALSSDEPISFADEMKNVKAYLNIEKLRFGDSLKINYEIKCKDFKVIPLTIQPLAENAVRHGVYPKGEDGGTVTIRSYETNDVYVVEVEDNGVGFDINEIFENKNDSVGLRNLIFRLKSLMHANVAIKSDAENGTRVEIKIPKDTI